MQIGWQEKAVADSTVREELLQGQQQEAMRPMFQVGEVLEYKVSYSFFDIGRVVMKIDEKFEKNGRTTYSAHATMDSNPSLSWIADLHVKFYGEMDELGYSYWWISDDSGKNSIDYRRMNFDNEKKRMSYERGKRDFSGVRKPEVKDTVRLSGKSYDGLSLFYYARNYARTRQQVNVPTYIDQKEAFTFINFMNERTKQEIDAVDYNVETIHLDGKANFVGIFGLTGGFEGWFSNDDARIPITARLKVILGSVKVELVKWNRPGWQPPKYQ